MSFNKQKIRKHKYFKILIAFLLISIYKLCLSISDKSIIKIKRHPYDIFSPSHKTFIEAHRGVNREIFQNTIESFKKVLEYDIESLETDTWLTKDNILVIYHGYINSSLLNGFFDHPGEVTKLTWDELSSYRTINDNLMMPKLSEVFELAKSKLFINLEIKDPRIDLVFPKVIELIQKYDFFNQIALSSFHFGYYDRIQEYNKKNDKNLTFGFVYLKTIMKKNKINFDYSKTGNSLNIHWSKAKKKVCKKAHKNGMAVLAYFRIHDRENDEIYRKLIENGVDVICSNEPRKAKKFRDNYFNS